MSPKSSESTIKNEASEGISHNQATTKMVEIQDLLVKTCFQTNDMRIDQILTLILKDTL